MAAEKKKEKVDKYGKDSKRASQEVIEARIERTIELLSLCTPYGDLCRRMQEEWGVSTDTTERYIAKARARIRERWNSQSRQDWVATALDRMDRVAEMSMKSGQQSNAIGATSLQAKLLGIAARDN